MGSRLGKSEDDRMVCTNNKNELEWTLAAPLNYVLQACFESCYGLMEIVHIRVIEELGVISVEVHPHPMFLNETLQIR